MKKIVILILFLCLSFVNICFAQDIPASQIQRTQEILEEEEELREKLNKQEKVFINKIIVEGVLLLDEEEVKDIVLPFQKRWLTEDDINPIIDSLKQLYNQQTKQTPEITYQIKGRNLKITVKEAGY